MKKPKSSLPIGKNSHSANSFKYTVIASLISCLFVGSAAFADNAEFTGFDGNGVQYHPFREGGAVGNEWGSTGTDTDIAIKKYTYNNVLGESSDENDWKLTEETVVINKNLEPQVFNGILSTASDNSYDPSESREIGDWLTVNFQTRTPKKDDFYGIAPEEADNMNAPAKLGNQSAIGDTNAFITIDDVIKATNESPDKPYSKVAGKWNRFEVSGFTREASDTEIRDGGPKFLGVAMNLDQNTKTSGALANIYISDNHGILTITDYDTSNERGEKRGLADSATSAYGGAIYIGSSNGYKGRIEGDFIGNSVELAWDGEAAKDKDDTFIHADGGAIYVAGTWKSEAADDKDEALRNSYFAKNSAQRGGAIFNNRQEVGNIVANFIENKANGIKLGNGGAIYNETDSENSQGSIGNITGAFIDNTANASDGGGNGGAIFNNAKIGNITGVFSGNKASGTELSRGGAIYNRARVISIQDGTSTREVLGSIGTIDAYFLDNEAHQGAAIANQGTITAINGYFEGNKANGIGGNHVYGGAISNGEGWWDGDGTLAGAGEVKEKANIGAIKASFYKNSVGISGSSDGEYYGRGGAIANIKNASIDTIEGDFIQNTASGNGGAVYNTSGIGVITGDFIANVSEAGSGGAIANVYASTQEYPNMEAESFSSTGTINEINSDFYQNKAGANGGAVFNGYKMLGLNTDNFIENSAGENGGAIYNNGLIDNEINANFFYNEAGAQGGAIYNAKSPAEINKEEQFGDLTSGELKAISSNFLYNTAKTGGGAVYNGEKAVIDALTGNFAFNESGEKGGAIANEGDIKKISGYWYANNVKGEDALGGAIWNGSDATLILESEQDEEGIKDIVFYSNYVNNASSDGYRNDVHNDSGSDDSMTINGNTIVWLNGGVTGSGTLYNKGKLYPDNEKDSTYWTIIENEIQNSGTIVVKDERQLFVGSKAALDGLATRAANNGTVLNMNDGSTFELGVKAQVRITGNYHSVGTEPNSYETGLAPEGNSNPDMVVRVGFEQVGTDSGTIMKPVTGLITVDGDLQGHTNVIVSGVTDENGKQQELVVGRDITHVRFLEAPNDDITTDSSFGVSRVYGSPYMWRTRGFTNAQDTYAKEKVDGSRWYLELLTKNDANGNPEPEDNPDKDKEDPYKPDFEHEKPVNNLPGLPPTPEAPKKDEPKDDPVFAPEVGAMAAIHQIAFEQTRSINDNVWRGISFEYNPHCQQKSCTGEDETQRNAWVQLSYESGRVKTPAKFDAWVRGLTLGVDFYHDNETRAGVFGAYRDGDYDLNGHGRYYSTLGTRVENETYLGGLYYKYDDQKWVVFSTLYAGHQNMDLHTRDKAVHGDTSAWQYGINAKVGRRYWHDDRTNITPFIGASYQIIDINDFNDNAGKTAKMDVLHYGEVSLGAKFEYVYCREDETVRYYVQPSVSRSFSEGGRTWITGVDETIKTFDDRTMLRADVGGEWSFHHNWSAFVNAGYATGDHYRAYDINAGLSYHF